jgi:hypothetical protein
MPHRTADLFQHDAKGKQAQATTHSLIQKRSKPKKAVESKRTAQKDPKEVIPFNKDQEKDEEVLKNF